MKRFAVAVAVAVLSALVALPLWSPPAHAGTILDAAAASLRRDPVYLDPAAERTISQAEADELRGKIRSSGTPIFIAFLPVAVLSEVPSGSPDDLPAAL